MYFCCITGAVIRPQMMLNNFRHNAPPSSFPNPIQRPGLQIPTNQRPPRPQLGSQPNPVGAPPRPSSSVPPTLPPTSNMSSTLKAQQEKQRQDLLAHAQNFLNPQNKPSIKQTGKVEVSAGDKKPVTKPGGSNSSSGNNAKPDDGKATDTK